MITTLDKAGRVVIPATLREKAGLRPGDEFEITIDEMGIRLVALAKRPRIVRIGKRLVARPSAPMRDRPGVDMAPLVEEERKRWPW
jgi:AbrB family looped-hinge helix DNA binding protein